MGLIDIITDVFLITILGMLVAFSPMLIIISMVLVLKSSRPILNTVILMAGYILSLFLLFIFASLLIDPNSDISLRKIKSDLDLPAIVDIIAGLTLVGWASKKYTSLKGARSPKKLNDFKIPEKPLHLFGFGFAKALLSATNLFAVLILAKVVTEKNWSIAQGVVAILWLLVVGIMPLLAIVYYHEFKNEKLLSINNRLNSAMDHDKDMILTYALAIVGMVFVLSGVVGIIRA
jgi:hypothetical protein